MNSIPVQVTADDVAALRVADHGIIGSVLVCRRNRPEEAGVTVVSQYDARVGQGYIILAKQIDLVEGWHGCTDAEVAADINADIADGVFR